MMRRLVVVVGVACFALGLVGCKGSSSGGDKGGQPVGAEQMKAQQMEGAKALKASGKTPGSKKS
jgi:hypothetical protein